MYKLVTAPTSEPISLADAKEHLRILHTDQDDMITGIIKAARFQFERDVPNIRLMPQTWALYLDEWPSWKKYFKAHVLIQKEPITSISKVEYIASGETDYTELATTAYASDKEGYPGRIELLETPDLKSNAYNTVKVTFACGFADAASVPADIIQAMKLLIGHFYNNPQQVMTGTQVNELPFGYRQISMNYLKDWV